MQFTDAVGAGDASAETNHVCAFCQTAFDSQERVCPVCDAKIVVRGER
ncbi:hypothetical protein [Haladaptatus sp. NG-SE-30]